MILNNGKYLVKTCWIEPNEWLVLLNRHKALIMGRYCHRPYSAKEKIKKKLKQKVEINQPAPEVVPEKVESKSEFSSNEEIIKDIIEKSEREKYINKEGKSKREKNKNNADAGIEASKKYPVICDYLLQNIMDFPLHRPADFDDCAIGETTLDYANSFPSISAILSETKSPRDKYILERWKKKMIVQLGETVFYNQQTDPVKKIQSKKVLPKNVKKSNKIISEKISRGCLFHSVMKKRLLGEDYEKLTISDKVKGCLESVKNILNEISDVKLVESCVYHPLLHYKGNIDCIANYRNEWHVIEWKVGEAAKRSLASTYSAPIQTCAYMGTLTWCKQSTLTEPISKGLIIFAFADGSPAQVFPINSFDSQIFWEQWLKRIQTFWAARTNRNKIPVENEQNLDHSENSS